MYSQKVLATLLCVCCVAVCLADESYPRIANLDSKDAVFRQYSQDVQRAYADVAQGRDFSMGIYVYAPKKDDTLIRLAARCGLPYETIASINKVASADEGFFADRDLFLPTVAGLFVTTAPETNLECLLVAKFLQSDGGVQYDVGGTTFVFFQGEKLSPTERAFFLDSGFASPLPRGILTSKFGKRISPISGKEHNHSGVDLAAPLGTAVYAAKNGVVKECAYSEIYGNFVRISHSDTLESLYGHLSEFSVEAGSKILQGQEVGKVGSTGASTGPHLHFEVRSGGRSQDINRMFRRNRTAD